MSKVKEDRIEMIEDIVEEMVEDECSEEENTPDYPSPTSPEYVNFILDQLADHELWQGSPTTDGLRRVTEDVYGQILVSNSDPISSPTDRLGHATVKHSLVIDRYDGKGLIEISACVDVDGKDLPHPFNQHVVATACTRAEGKALRRALKIRVQTAEELVNNQADEDDDTANDPLNDQQKLAINQLCKRNNIDAIKIIKSVASAAKKLSEVKNIDGRFIMNKIAEYQRNQSSIEESLLGYQEDWQEKFGG